MGPLDGFRIVELAGIGPGPFCAMMLADHGAQITRIDRPSQHGASVREDILSRSRRSIAVNLKDPAGVRIVRDLCRSSHGIIEGFRPGVTERLGLGPEELLADNPQLVYGRVTGWGQFGPLARSAGHDINYIAIAGALHACGRSGEKPTPPMNLIGDFGGGGMLMAFGMVCALLAARQSGCGQVVDCAMTDGAALLMSMVYSFRASGTWMDKRGSNVLDSGAHFYDTYETSDGKFIAIGAIEPTFYAQLRRYLGIADDPTYDSQLDPDTWDALRKKLEILFKKKTRDEWCSVLENTDACFAPVLSLAEAPKHPHNEARSTFIEIDGVIQPAPAPRYSRTQTVRPLTSRFVGADTENVLRELGYDDDRIADLRKENVLA